MKIAIVIITYNIPIDVFLLQMEAIDKFCYDEDYEIKIFDNSTDPEKAEHVRYHAEQNGVSYYKIFSTSNNSSDSHSWACNFAYQKIKEDYDYHFFLDHDCIPVLPFSVEEILGGGHLMAGLGQGALKTYFWAGCVMFASNRINPNIIDFSPNGEFGLDSGGNLYKAIELYGKENCIFFNEAYHQNPYFNGVSFGHYATINNGMFCHIVNSSNWYGADRQEERMNSMINVIREKMNAHVDK